MTATDSEPEPVQLGESRFRAVLGMVGDKWSLLVVCNLKEGPRRFSELRHTVDGISQRMLTVTLRKLERDGILTRTVHNVMPPHVSYALTSMGSTLCQATLPLLEWSAEHLAHIDDARAEYDSRAAASPAGSARDHG